MTYHYQVRAFSSVKINGNYVVADSGRMECSREEAVAMAREWQTQYPECRIDVTQWNPVKPNAMGFVVVY